MQTMLLILRVTALTVLVGGMVLLAYFGWLHTLLTDYNPVILPALFPIALAGAVWLLPTRHWPIRLFALFLFLFALCGAIWLAGLEGSRAFNECVQQQEQIRGTLAEFKARHGAFPLSLSHAFSESPCRPLGRSTILYYRSDGATYNLSFSDRLVTFEATDSEPFEAHK